MNSLTDRLLNAMLERLPLIRFVFVLSLAAGIAVDIYVPTDRPIHGIYFVPMTLAGFAFFGSPWLRILLAGGMAGFDFKAAALSPHIERFVLQGIMYALVAEVMAGMVKVKVREKHSTLNLMKALAKSLDSRDAYTACHSENVARYASLIANEMKLPKKECDAVYIGARLHDIGKIGVPEMILTKPAKLNDDEFEIIKKHPVIGYDTVKHVPLFQKNGVLDMILFHHERYDGKGYPYGLQGDQIPRGARIIALADSMDAMLSSRTYRKKMGVEYALHEVRSNRGKQFDPDVVDALLAVFEKEGGKVFLQVGNPIRSDLAQVQGL